MHSVYVIQNKDSKEIYIGKTNDLKRRLQEHDTNQQSATSRKKCGQWILVYAEVFASKQDCDERERKLKQHGSNKRWLKNRIKHSLLED